MFRYLARVHASAYFQKDFRWKPIYILWTLSCLLNAANAAPTSSTHVAESTIIPFHLVSQFGVVIPVYINGHGPYSFLLDTGATVTAIDRSIAAELNIRSVGAGSVTSLAERLAVDIGVASSVSFGPVSKSQVEVLVRNLGGLQAADSSIVGVLGQNVLKRADFLIDYSQKIIQVDLDGSVIRGLKGRRLPIVTIPVPDSSEYTNPAVCVGMNQPSSCESLLLLDSGTASFVVFRDVPNLGPPIRETFVQDAAGVRRGAEVYSVHLCLQDMCRTLEAQKTDFKEADTRVQGLLPTVLFRKLYISNSGGFIVAEPTTRKKARQKAGLMERI